MPAIHQQNRGHSPLERMLCTIIETYYSSFVLQFMTLFLHVFDDLWPFAARSTANTNPRPFPACLCSTVFPCPAKKQRQDGAHDRSRYNRRIASVIFLVRATTPPPPHCSNMFVPLISILRQVPCLVRLSADCLGRCSCKSSWSTVPVRPMKHHGTTVTLLITLTNVEGVETDRRLYINGRDMVDLFIGAQVPYLDTWV